MAEYLINGENITSVADKIRSKNGTTDALSFPNDFISAIDNLANTSDGTATPSDISSGKTAYVNGQKITGTHSCSSSSPNLQSKTVTPSESAQTVSPDSGYDGLFQVSVDAISSTYVGSGITKKAAATYTPTTSNQTIAKDQYLSGVQTIKGDSNLVSGNIKNGVSIFGISGTYEGSGSGDSGGIDTSDATATADNIEDGYTAYVNGEKITGNITSGNINNLLANSSTYSNDGTPAYYESSGTGSLDSPTRIGIKYTNNSKKIVSEKGTVTAFAKASLFGDATPSDVALGKTFTSVSGLKVTGTRADSGGSSSGLVVKSGTTTSSTIETGLTNIKYIYIYKDSLTARGFMHGMYIADEGKLHYVYCSSYDTYVKSCTSSTSTASTVDGGTFTTGLSGTSDLNGATYNWIAYGE